MTNIDDRESGYVPPEDAATDVRQKREEAEEIKKQVAARMVEEEALARLEKKQEEDSLPKVAANESGGEMLASEARVKHYIHYDTINYINKWYTVIIIMYSL